MAERPHPVDVVTDDLARTYAAGSRRLEALIGAALRRGLDASRYRTPEQQRGDATLAYRERQLAAARAVIDDLERRGRAGASVIARQAYGASILSVDRVIGPDSALARNALEGRFGGIHQRQVSVIAGNLERSLEASAARARANVEAVFARAAMLEGALPPEGLPAFSRFIGRRVDDPWRRVALEVAGAGNVALDTRRQLTAELVRRLQTEGITDALTGFVDRAGRRWSLEAYSTMVARTLGREASSRATIGRLEEHGVDLVGITSHPHQADECSPYDGKTFARPGTAAALAGEYPVLDRMPPFHPRCRHVLGPAGDGSILDRFERELGIAAREPVTWRPIKPISRSELGRGPSAAPLNAPGRRFGIEPPRPPVPVDTLPTPTPADPPLGPLATPNSDALTAERLEAQRVMRLIDGDPGPEPGAREAWEAAVDRTARKDLRALNVALGEDLAKELDRAWAKRAGIKADLLRGELTIEEAEDLAVEEWHRREGKRIQREEQGKANDAVGKVNCFVCGRFKRRPADVCEWCGDDPVPNVNYAGGGSHGGDYYQAAQRFNRSHGYYD